MNHWKTLACTALLFPAMAVGQMTEPGSPETYSPGMRDRPGETQSGMPAQPGEKRDYLSSMGSDQFLANNLIGKSVRTRSGQSAEPGMSPDAHEGEEVGTVEDLILDQQGQVAGIVTDRNVALTWGVIEVQQDPQDPEFWIVFTDMDQQDLEQAPEFQDEAEQDGGIL